MEKVLVGFVESLLHLRPSETLNMCIDKKIVCTRTVTIDMNGGSEHRRTDAAAWCSPKMEMFGRLVSRGFPDEKGQCRIGAIGHRNTGSIIGISKQIVDGVRDFCWMIGNRRTSADKIIPEINFQGFCP